MNGSTRISEETSQGAFRARWARGSSKRRGLIASLAALCSVAVFFVAAGVGAEPALAKAGKTILLKDSLSKASSAVQAGSGNGFVGSFVTGKFLLQNSIAQTQVYSPTFNATSAQLSAISVDVDVSLATPTTLAGLNCRAGDTPDTRYAFLIRGNGQWLVGKSLSPNNTMLASGSVKIRPHETFHLRFECSGPEQPGPTGTVTGKFFINGRKVATVTDAMSALPVVLPAAVGLEVDHVGAASFSNITVAQL
jgi:hypothetical protein